MISLLDVRNTIFSKIFIWLGIGLLVTFGTGYAMQLNEPLLYSFFSNSYYIFVWIAEIVIAIILSIKLRKLSGPVAKILYLVYAALTGITFSSIFIVYDLGSIMFVFGVTAVILLLLGYYGYKTNTDLTKLGTFLLIGILSIILLCVINVFVDSTVLDTGTTFLSLAIFTIYIAYDVQMIKRRMYSFENEESLAIYGAFELYLDFINIFIDLLKLLGKEK